MLTYNTYIGHVKEFICVYTFHMNYMPSVGVQSTPNSKKSLFPASFKKK